MDILAFGFGIMMLLGGIMGLSMLLDGKRARSLRRGNWYEIFMILVIIMLIAGIVFILQGLEIIPPLFK